MLSALLFLGVSPAPASIALTPAETQRIGRKIWQNECGGTVVGLTSWNVGEDFASLGIGHFIWYPKGVHGPFDESFPDAVSFISKRGVAVPEFLRGRCPWNSRTEFQQAGQSKPMQELRKFLVATIDDQAQFLVFRLDQSVAKMLTVSSNHTGVQKQFDRVSGSGADGSYALVDYVNFKGEGILATERYRGEGWGLLQVLETMSGNGNPVADFSNAARNVLKRRVQNSPSARHESRWLQGWLARINTYSRG